MLGFQVCRGLLEQRNAGARIPDAYIVRWSTVLCYPEESLVKGTQHFVYPFFNLCVDLFQKKNCVLLFLSSD